LPDWNNYALIATIELAREKAGNPELPNEFQSSYDFARDQLVAIGLRELEAATDATLASSIVGATTSGLRALGRLAIDFTEVEGCKMLAGPR
jgi:hypothetical protein